MHKSAFLVAWGFFLLGTNGTGSEPTALDKYVQAPDSNYSWKIENKIEGEGYHTYLVDMVSQRWLTEAEVNQPVWRHWMTVTVPKEIKHSTGLLFIGGGSNRNPAPKGGDENMVKMAMETGTVVTELRMVPNQPLIFNNDGKERVEDDLIAYTWDKYLRTGDERWPARLPMTKAAVRAMDTITAISGRETGVKVEKFVVSGGSKRGWTTWTTAATDQRVVAIAPLVIDLLNVVPSFKHHYGVYGFWAPAVKDYVAHGIMNWTDTPEYEALMKIEEPFEYRERLTMPKFIINSAGDQFFLPDSAQFYFEELKGPKYLRYVPNSDHSLRKTDAHVSLLAFYDAIVNKKPLPEFSWSIPEEGTIRVETKTRPSRVRLWQAHNPEVRDFRLDQIGPVYRDSELKAEKEGVYVAEVAKPVKGYTAYFVELMYDNKPAPFTFTTEVRVIPDVAPFKDKLPKPSPPKGFMSKGS